MLVLTLLFWQNAKTQGCCQETEKQIQLLAILWVKRDKNWSLSLLWTVCKKSGKKGGTSNWACHTASFPFLNICPNSWLVQSKRVRNKKKGLKSKIKTSEDLKKTAIAVYHPPRRKCCIETSAPQQWVPGEDFTLEVEMIQCCSISYKADTKTTVIPVLDCLRWSDTTVSTL